jgi:DNA-binding CsgD family transcriptional regulator
MTVKQLALELSIGESSVRTSIRRARAGGRTDILRIAGWAADVPRYGPGPGDDEEGGSTSDRVMQSLEDHGPATVAALATRLKATIDTVDNAVRRLRKKRGNLHIKAWKTHRGSGGREAAVYASGPGKDAERPTFENAQREAERRYQEKKRVQRGVASSRGPNKPKALAVAGFFDGLMR